MGLGKTYRARQKKQGIDTTLQRSSEEQDGRNERGRSQIEKAQEALEAPSLSEKLKTRNLENGVRKRDCG